MAYLAAPICSVTVVTQQQGNVIVSSTDVHLKKDVDKWMEVCLSLRLEIEARLESNLVVATLKFLPL